MFISGGGGFNPIIYLIPLFRQPHYGNPRLVSSLSYQHESSKSKANKTTILRSQTRSFSIPSSTMWHVRQFFPLPLLLAYPFFLFFLGADVGNGIVDIHVRDVT